MSAFLIELLGIMASLMFARVAAARKTRPLVVFCAGIAALLTWLLGGLILVVVLLAGLGWYGRVRWQHRGAQETAGRWNRSSARHQGMAGRWQLLWTSSTWAMRRHMTVLRPSFAALTWWERLRMPVEQFAVPLTRVGWFRIWSTVEEMVCQYGRPRRGKSGQLIHWVVDAPGAAVVASTKPDLKRMTEGLRRKVGPTHCFNPTAIGDVPSTIGFDPLVDCEDPERAGERAVDLISGGAGRADGDGKRWDAQAQRVMTGLLHAAALGGHQMTDVLSWVADPDGAKREVMALLRMSPSAYAFAPAAEQFFSTNSRTRSSVTFTIMPALEWLSNANAVAATQGATRFDVKSLLADKATVYLLAEASSRMGPLLSALAGYIAREARRIAMRCPGERLDPGLRLVLDEAANICPVPLDEWSSYFGSAGITIIATFQSRAQVIKRWGLAGARDIANNTGATILHAYGSDTDDLAHFVTLSGHRTDEHGHRVPVLSLTHLTNLPKGTTVVWPPETPVTIGRMAPGWKRDDVRAQLKLERVDAQALVAGMEDFLEDVAVGAESAGAAGGGR
jgi:type IV secretion system protein VirD4